VPARGQPSSDNQAPKNITNNSPPCEACCPLSPAAKRLRSTIEWREYNKGHTIAGEEELSAIRDFIKAGYQRPEWPMINDQ
jgi:hypothetical protein